MIRGAEFSPCGKYRYQLYRIWGDGSGKVAMCIGLNPSIAGSKKKNGEERDDQTITWLINSLTVQGYDGLRMTNLYALVSSKPRKLFEVSDALKNNDVWIESTAFICQEVIFCWGSFKGIGYRAKLMIAKFPNALCFGKNMDGSPWHPLALMYKGIKPKETKLIKY